MQRSDNNVSGIYAIIHETSGKRYVGKAFNIRLRWNQHRTGLNRNTHHCIHLQRAWNKHGATAFAFVILELVEDRSQLFARERYWFDQYAPEQRYNKWLYPGCPGGYRHTPESRALMAARQRGVSPSSETRAKISAALTGRKGHPLTPENKSRLLAARRKAGYSAEMREKLRQAHLGRKLSPEHVAKVAAKSRGRKYGPPSAEKREKISRARTGIKHTPEAIAKIAAASRGRKRSPESITKGADKIRGRPKSPEAIANLRAKMATPEVREHMCAAAKNRVVSDDGRRKMSEVQKRRLREHPELHEELVRRARNGARKRHGLPPPDVN